MAGGGVQRGLAYGATDPRGNGLAASP
jgi:hypothetical protein